MTSYGPPQSAWRPPDELAGPDFSNQGRTAAGQTAIAPADRARNQASRSDREAAPEGEPLKRGARRTGITVAARVTMQTTGSDLLQARSERCEGGQRGEEHPREVGTNLIRILARSGSKATAWLHTSLIAKGTDQLQLRLRMVVLCPLLLPSPPSLG